MAAKRNYLPKEDFPKMGIYHNTIDDLIEKSDILNGSGQRTTIHLRFWDKISMVDEINKYLGDQYGQYISGENKLCTAYIPYIDMRLRETEQDLLRYKQQQKSQGQGEVEEPRHLLNQRLILEAKRYVLCEEVSELQKRLDKIAEEEKKVAYTKILEKGPVGAGVVKNNSLISVDGMPCRYFLTDGLMEGILIIDCDHPRAKDYDGHSTADYFSQIVRPWKLQCSIQAEKTKAMVLKKGLKWETVSRGKRMGLDTPVPKFNADSINYKELVAKPNNK